MSVEGEIGELRASIRDLRSRLDKAEQRLEWIERESQSHGERLTGLWREFIHKPSKRQNGDRDRPITNRDVLVAVGAVSATLAAFKAMQWLAQMVKP